MADLSEFLLARIAEDEAVLTQSEPLPHWTHLSDTVGTFGPRCPTCRGGLWGGRTRALAECEAKRRIVNGWMTAASMDRNPGPDYAAFDAHIAALEFALQALAMPYADHPDFRPEWSAHALM